MYVRVGCSLEVFKPAGAGRAGHTHCFEKTESEFMRQVIRELMFEGVTKAQKWLEVQVYEENLSNSFSPKLDSARIWKHT